MATMTVTCEQAAKKVAGFGVPLANFFWVQDDNEPEGEIVIWYPEVGLRGLIIENDAMARACDNYLRDVVRVRRFKSWEELSEAQRREQWEGWNTCSDYVRHRQTAEELRLLEEAAKWKS